MVRLKIEVEATAEELPLVSELVSLLKNLTSDVSVTTTNGAAQHAPSPAPGQPAAAAPAPAAASAGPSPEPAAAAAAPPPPQAAAPAPPTPAHVAAPTAAGKEHWVQFPPGMPAEQQLQELIVRMEATPHEHYPAIAAQLEDVILHGPGGHQVLFPQFLSGWMSQMLNPDLPNQERSAVNFVMPLQHVSQDMKTRLRDAAIPLILKHLAIKRPPTQNADRSEYYVHAEAFAALASIEVVLIEGALQTMCALLRKPDNRGAAITMLGKTVELCSHLISEKIPAENPKPNSISLAKMRDAVSSVTEEEFAYDVSFIMETMGWAAPGAHGPAAGHAAGRTLHPVQSCEGHGELIFALAADPVHRQFVSGGKDSFLQVWGEDGHQLQRLDLGDKYVSCMDYHSGLGLLLCSGLTKPSNPPLFLAAYASSQPNGFAPRGFLARPNTAAIACVRALPETNGFLTGESVNVGGPDPSNDIIYFDVAAAPSFHSLQPTSTFRGHAHIVTALGRFPGQKDLFVSGDKGGAISLWDLRVPNAVAAFGDAQQGLAHFAPTPKGMQGSMVTALDACDHLLFSSSVDKTVKLWDLRRAGPGTLVAPLTTVGDISSVVLKVAINAGARVAAAATIGGLYTIDFSVETAPVLAQVQAAWPGGRIPQTYHDVKWDEARNVLYAAGKDKVVDLYALA